MKSAMDAAEDPVFFIPRLLKTLSPVSIDLAPGDPIAACRLLDSLSNGIESRTPASPLGTLWPRLPQIIPNSYSLATAKLPALLPVFDSGPVQLINIPGVNADGQQLPALGLSKSVCGHIIASNGEVAFERIDATIPGPFEFHWRRFYRQSNREDSGLGPGWRHSLSEQLHIREDGAELHTAEGRRIHFKIPAIGHGCYNRYERLLLHRQSLHSYRIIGFDQPLRIFRADGVNSALPLVEIRDQFGNALSIDYRNGLPSKIVSSWGRVVEIHSREGRIEKLINTQAPDNQSELCRYEYESQILTDATTGQARENYAYRDQQLATIECNRRGQLLFNYDNHGRCCELQHNERLHKLSWRRSERRCTLRINECHPIEWKFNHSGHLVDERQHNMHRRWLYDHYGNLCEEITADDQRCIYRYDELGRLTRRTRNQVSDRYLYDQRGFLTAILRRDEQLWRFHYNERGCPDKITDPENHVWQCQYSDRGQLIQLKDPEGGSVHFNWDSQAQLQTVQRSDRNWGFEYDHWHRLTALIEDGNTLRSWRYGQAGQLLEATIGDRSFQLEYTEDGQPNALRDNRDQILCWQSDAAGRCRKIQFPGGQIWQLHYDTHGQLHQLETPAGNTIWNYDGFGRVTAREDANGRLRQWHYYPDGRLREYRDSDLRWYFRYADDGTLAQIRNNSGQHCDFRSDRHGRIIQADNTHAFVRFQYDHRDRLIAEHHDSKDADSLTLRHDYDTRGWLKSTSSDCLALTYTLAPSSDLYGVDANGEVILRCETEASAIAWVQGELRSRRSYEYGQMTELSAGPGLSWQFPTEEPLHLSAPEQAVPETKETAILRDKRGSVIRELRADNQREYLYQYDGWGLLASAECGDFKTWFRYDPFGRRLSKLSTHRKSTRQRRVDTRWYSMGLWSEIHVLNNRAEPAIHYIHHPLDQTLLCRWREDAIEHYLTSPEGQPLALFDHEGKRLWVKGEHTEHNISPGPWRGRGRIGDSETGLYYTLRGYWHPLLKIWINTIHD
ncbi:DUF6531 domain-containing protein [Microbulbifer thermotolerans]|uniref:DUF6531 domain-containing protein n=1 Tax=Microbulbifer thermotolerans TaxID=252514 RepID=UPI0022498AE8|nr:DUF6531 domain-containing protein [Microbulbifer thermotolerans]MCX2780326.1 DUF6531 domain-containing protein [Microbulbifer thermotolerans]MCX2795544.1 DUF6531 domain-containing protein [Microbulbifer thermotolerans]MCX2805343.1 DUF6531 domain-containing protein [Microbulbifer thermotolerans]